MKKFLEELIKNAKPLSPIVEDAFEAGRYLEECNNMSLSAKASNKTPLELSEYLTNHKIEI